MTGPVRYSRGVGKFDSTPVQCEAEDFAALCNAIEADGGRTATKARAPYIAGPCGIAPDDAKHRDGASMGKAIGHPHRCRDCAEPRAFIGGDVDGGMDAESFAALVAILHCYSGMVWTTHSSTPDAPRCRVLLALDAEAERDELIRASEAARKRIDGLMVAAGYPALVWDASCDRPEQPLFLPPPGAWLAELDGAPLVLAELLTEAREKSPARAPTTPRAPIALAMPGGGTPYGRAALESAVRNVAAASPGTRNHTLNREAYGMGGLVAVGAVAREDAEAALVAAAEHWDNPAKTRGTLRGGIVAGMARPRIDQAPAALDTPVWTPGEHDRFTYDEVTDEPEPTRYIVEPYLTEECAAVLVGAGGTSKTGVLTLLSVHIATGMPLFGGAVEQGAVLFITAEDRRKVLRKHLWAHARNLPPPLRQRLVEHFIPKDVVGLGVKLTRRIDGETVVAPDVSALIAYATTIPKLKLVVFDTLSRLNGGDEMTDGLAAIISAMEAVARATGAATIIAHHTGKAQHRDGIADQYTTRGGSALSDNSRSVMLVQVVGGKDKEAPCNAGELIPQERLLRLTHVKANDVKAPTRYLQRIPTAHRAQIAPFDAQFTSDSMAGVWHRLAEWMRQQRDIPYPTARTIEALDELGSRDQRRRIVGWALDRGLLREAKHPQPQGQRKTYLVLADGAMDGALEAAA